MQFRLALLLLLQNLLVLTKIYGSRYNDTHLISKQSHQESSRFESLKNLSYQLLVATLYKKKATKKKSNDNTI